MARERMKEELLKDYIDDLGKRVLAKFLPPCSEPTPKRKRQFIVKQKYPANYQPSSSRPTNPVVSYRPHLKSRLPHSKTVAQ